MRRGSADWVPAAPTISSPSQYQAGGARGGVSIQFTDGTNTNWTTVDTDGQVMNSDTTENAWHYRTVDLSGFAGKTADVLWIDADARTPVGPWNSYFADIAIYSTGGNVTPIYYRQSSTGFTYFSNGDISNPQASVQISNSGGDPEYPLNTTTYYQGDQIGSTRMLTAAAGWPVSSSNYYPYGQGPQPEVNHYLFTGKQRDSESGLDYFGARYYASSMGRFLRPDPAGIGYADPSNPQSLNLYSYVYNNPLINIDPSGMECVWDDGSYDASDDPDTGSAKKCTGQGGTWVNPNLFGSVEGNQAGSWSGDPSSSIAFDWLTPSSTTNAGAWDFDTDKAYLSLWESGMLPTELNYGPNDPAALAMINRPYVQAQLAAYAKAGCPAIAPAGQPSVDAYAETRRDVVSGNPNYVQAEVGDYSGNISTSGGVTTVTITNISGRSSFYGYSAGVGEVNKYLGTHFNRNALDKTTGPKHNVHQTFTWKEPSPCG